MHYTADVPLGAALINRWDWLYAQEHVRTIVIYCYTCEKLSCDIIISRIGVKVDRGDRRRRPSVQCNQLPSSTEGHSADTGATKIITLFNTMPSGLHSLLGGTISRSDFGIAVYHLLH